MTLVVKDRVKETTSTTGTGALSLSGAAAGFQSFAVIGNGNTTYYAITEPSTSAWEVGLGTYTLSGTTLARTTVLSSSNGGSAVNFAAGVKDVFVTYPAERAVIDDGGGNLTATSFTGDGSSLSNVAASTATALQTARTIGGVSFNGSANINLPGVNAAGNQSTTGNAATATNVAYSGLTGTVPTWNQNTTGNAATATNVAYSGLTGTVPTWNQNTTGSSASTTGNAATATVLQTTRAINGVNFNGSAAITVEPYVEDAVTTSVTRYLTFVDNSTAGFKRLNEDANLSYNPGTNVLTVPTVSGALSGNATTATTLQTARTIGGVSFNGSANINLPGVNATGNQNTSGSSASCTGNAATATNVAYSGLTGTAPTWNQNTTGTAGNTSSITNATGSSFTWTGTQQFQSNQNTSGANPPLQAFSSSGGAIMAFHRGSVFAINMGLDSDNVFRIGGWSATANRLQMDMSGNLTMSGNVTAYSDERLKKDWEEVKPNFVDQLANVKSGTYTRTDSDERQAGVSAQSLQELLPETVIAGNDGILSVAYGNAAMVAVVELAKEIRKLKEELKALKGQ